MSLKMNTCNSVAATLTVAISSTPAARILIEGAKDPPHEFKRPLRWAIRSQPLELERHQDRPTQFVETPVIVLLGQNLSGEEYDRLPPNRGTPPYSAAQSVL
jgi:hypothetical protein